MPDQCITIRAVNVLNKAEWIFSSDDLVPYELSLPPGDLFDIFRSYKRGMLDSNTYIEFPMASCNLKTHVINIVKILA